MSSPDSEDEVIQGSQSDGTEDLSVEFHPAGRSPCAEQQELSSGSSAGSKKSLTGLARLLQSAPVAVQRQSPRQPSAVVAKVMYIDCVYLCVHPYNVVYRTISNRSCELLFFFFSIGPCPELLLETELLYFQPMGNTRLNIFRAVVHVGVKISL